MENQMEKNMEHEMEAGTMPVFLTCLGSSIYSHVKFAPCHIPDNVTGTRSQQERGHRLGAARSHAAAISIALFRFFKTQSSRLFDLRLAGQDGNSKEVQEWMQHVQHIQTSQYAFLPSKQDATTSELRSNTRAAGGVGLDCQNLVFPLESNPSSPSCPSRTRHDEGHAGMESASILYISCYTCCFEHGVLRHEASFHSFACPLLHPSGQGPKRVESCACASLTP